MAYVKKSRFRRGRKTTRGRRRAYRKRPMGKVLRAPVSKPHLFKRMGLRTLLYSNNGASLLSNNNDTGFAFTQTGSDVVSGTFQVGFAHQFRLSQMATYSEFTALFDKYKICKIVYNVTFMSNQAPVNGNSILPTLHICNDDDDATVPTSLLELQQRQRVKRRVMGTGSCNIKYSFRPKIASAVYNTALSTSYAVKSGYLNTDNYDTPHYGIKGYINNLYMTTNNSIAITIQPIYYLALRDVK